MKFYHLSVLLLPQQQGVINAAPSGFRSATGVAKNGAEPSSVSSSNNNNVQHGRRQLQTKSLTTVYFAECEGDCDTDNDCNVSRFVYYLQSNRVLLVFDHHDPKPFVVCLNHLSAFAL